MGGHETPIGGPRACSRHGGAAHGARRGSLHRGLYLDDRVTHAMAAMRRHGGRSTASITASHAGARPAAALARRVGRRPRAPTLLGGDELDSQRDADPVGDSGQRVEAHALLPARSSVVRIAGRTPLERPSSLPDRRAHNQLLTHAVLRLDAPHSVNSRKFPVPREDDEHPPLCPANPLDLSACRSGLTSHGLDVGHSHRGRSTGTGSHP
jgi:hypothetical protein